MNVDNPSTLQQQPTFRSNTHPCSKRDPDVNNLPRMDYSTTLNHRNSVVPTTVLDNPSTLQQQQQPTLRSNTHARSLRDPDARMDYSTILKHRNSVVPTAVVIPYTSLKDLLPPSPSSVLSPTPTPAVSSSPSTTTTTTATNGSSGYEISIRNRLVKQAAWAYLQSAVAAEQSSSRRLCISGEVLRRMCVGVGRLVVDTVRRVYEWLVDAMWLILCR